MILDVFEFDPFYSVANEAGNDSQRPSVLAVRCRFLRSPSVRDRASLLGLTCSCLNVYEIIRHIVCQLVGSKAEASLSR